MTDLAMHYKHLRRVFVWELPVRVYHWINALAIVLLCVTGFIIGNPPGIMFGGEAHESYWFGTVRFLHFAAAYIFLFNFLFRLYWGFVGNKYANWKNFIPTNRRFFKEMWEVLKIDILQIKSGEHLSIGHNALAGFIYFLTFIAFAVQCITGFGLYAAMSQAWIARMFAWVSPFLGGDFVLRQWHHAAMWFFILFAMVHVYLVFYHDYVEGRGEISSMGGGWKFIEEEVFEEQNPKTTA
ncbi:Ni/Fe-hydrogenase, b-type cytochrome subunit [Sphingobacteriales bacterium UPWRP_1]|nr:Ni/Fe-hydrogenase, b-type cytochrome subunit [Sphingobacteriales bacterium UPWRP_1]